MNVDEHGRYQKGCASDIAVAGMIFALLIGVIIGATLAPHGRDALCSTENERLTSQVSKLEATAAINWLAAEQATALLEEYVGVDAGQVERVTRLVSK